MQLFILLSTSVISAMLLVAMVIHRGWQIKKGVVVLPERTGRGLVGWFLVGLARLDRVVSAGMHHTKAWIHHHHTVGTWHKISRLLGIERVRTFLTQKKSEKIPDHDNASYFLKQISEHKAQIRKED